MPETWWRLGEQLARGLLRLRGSAAPIVEAALAAGLLAGRRAYCQAPCSVLRADRCRRVPRPDARSAAASTDRVDLGVGLGVGVGDLLIFAIGAAPWQIALVVALAMSVAVLPDGGAVIAIQAAIWGFFMVTL
jgi:hypothetical protein